MNPAKLTRQIKVGGVPVGGDAPITVQSMTNTLTADADATVFQIQQLEEAGCELIRVSVPDQASADSLRKIKAAITIPLIADIHFDYRMALESIDAGVDKIRINPGTLGQKNEVREVIKAASSAQIPMRIGLNSGSLPPEYKGQSIPDALCNAASDFAKWFEDEGFGDIVLSVKAASVRDTIAAYRKLADTTDYPLHVGLTEAGTLLSGAVKSAVALGVLLEEGIGDTLRVSLAADPVEEVRVGFHILKALGLRDKGVDIIACPTCARCEIDLVPLANEAEKLLAGLAYPLNVAIMGCAVNGPGEAKAADLGIAGGNGQGVLILEGKVVATLPEEELLDRLIKEAQNLAEKYAREGRPFPKTEQAHCPYHSSSEK